MKIHKIQQKHHKNKEKSKNIRKLLYNEQLITLFTKSTNLEK